jgi:glucosamine 6-phosphate synthetase-like amidotransferase/phosphosugar isomerase protein
LSVRREWRKHLTGSIDGEIGGWERTDTTPRYNDAFQKYREQRMCGILGFYIPTHDKIKDAVTARLLARLFQLSESRGKDAAGLAMASDDKIIVLREALSVGKMVSLPSYRQVVDSFLTDAPDDAPIATFGHARLATNGYTCCDNQPVARDGITLIHNGIVVNDMELWQEMGLAPETGLDSEVIATSIARKTRDVNRAPGLYMKD